MGGHGGHNGIRDIIGTFGEKFIRIKVGIKNSSYSENNIPADKFVLGNFFDEELNKIKLLKKKIINNLELIINKDFCSFKSKIKNGI
jgi:peptidyl-tRNA hydrolase